MERVMERARSASSDSLSEMSRERIYVDEGAKAVEEEVKIDSCFVVDVTVTFDTRVCILILYDKSEATFYRTAQMTEQLYRETTCAHRRIETRGSRKPCLLEFVAIAREFMAEMVVVHYIGHGANDGKKMHPNITVDGKLFDLVKFVEGSFPSLNTLVMMDCCNGVPTENPRMQLFYHKSVDILLKLTGHNWISSSRQGYYSYYILSKHTLFNAALETACHGMYDSVTGLLTALNHNLKKMHEERQLVIPRDGQLIGFYIAPGNDFDGVKFTQSIKAQSLQPVKPHSPDVGADEVLRSMTEEGGSNNGGVVGVGIVSVNDSDSASLIGDDDD
jgi:hypothetical protein